MYFTLFKSAKNGQWYWHFKAANHEIIASGAEGYISKQDALHGINLMKGNAAGAEVKEEELA